MSPAVRARATAAVGAALILTAATVTTAAADASTGKYVALGDSYVAGPLIPAQSGGLCLRSDLGFRDTVRRILVVAAFFGGALFGALLIERHRSHSAAGTLWCETALLCLAAWPSRQTPVVIDYRLIRQG